MIRSDCILIDEAPMLHRYIIEAIDRLLKQLMNNIPFGGKNVIFGGDFRQTLPVIPKADRATIIDKCFKNSYLWNEIQKFKLDINVRVEIHGHNPENNEFSDFIMNIGNGTLPNHPELGNDIIQIPDKYVFHNQNIHDLIDWCYPDLLSPEFLDENLMVKGILTPLNKDVDYLNDIALEKIKWSNYYFR